MKKTDLSRKITSLVCGGRTIAVEWPLKLSYDGEDAFGTYDGVVIVVCRQYDPTTQMVTLIHEALHSILKETGLSTLTTSEVHEASVRATSQAFFILLRDNPELEKRLGVLLRKERIDLSKRLGGK